MSQSTSSMRKRVRRTSSSSSDSEIDNAQRNRKSDSSLSNFKDSSTSETRVIPGPKEEFYAKHENMGRAVIFSNETFFASMQLKKREGTNQDAKSLQTFLHSIKFDVEVCHDFLVNEIEDKLNEIAKMDHEKSTCLIIVAMTHNKDGKLAAKDATYPAETLWNPFSSELCQGLLGKPKIFFIQACRGPNIDPGRTVNFRYESAGVENKESSGTIPVMADLLIFYSSFEGYVSYRNKVKGSPFIQCLVKKLNRSHDTKDLLSLLIDVSRTIALTYPKKENEDQSVLPYSVDQGDGIKKQMCTIVSTLTRKFLLMNKTEQYETYKKMYTICNKEIEQALKSIAN